MDRERHTALNKEQRVSERFLSTSWERLFHFLAGKRIVSGSRCGDQGKRE